MRALVLEEYMNLVYKDVPDPVIEDKEVLIQVKACGICGSDVYGMDGSTGRRQPPIIMGHEASGIIKQAGTNITNWHVGDRVTFDSTIYPLNDWYTLKGKYNFLKTMDAIRIAAALFVEADAFITNDIKLKKIDEIRILILKDYLKYYPTNYISLIFRLPFINIVYNWKNWLGGMKNLIVSNGDSYFMQYKEGFPINFSNTLDIYYSIPVKNFGYFL